ncbi:MAG: thiamine pyrophosphate-dependent dehydrogenase E1 component subunit alpha [Chloroflexi bacterium]|nr:thiamine pyrophosphate-dependent dehydrogenase E1 component subunit alpha [Chloroflexota bacterium]
MGVKKSAAPARARDQAKRPDLPPELLRDLFATMALARALDERMWTWSRQSKIALAVSCQGHEAVQVGSAFAIRRGVDWVLPYYRDMAVALAVGMTAEEVALNHLGKAADPSSGGRQHINHYGSRRLRIVTGSSVVASQLLHAAGIGLAAKLRGEDTVALVYFGDGASSQGDTYEAMNFAGIHRLPVVFVCENNGWAISVPQSRQFAVPDLTARAAGCGFPGVAVDGLDVVAVYLAARDAVERARQGLGPTLIEAKCFRRHAHGSSDDDRHYRTAEDRARWESADPVRRFRRSLLDRQLATEEELDLLDAKVQQIVEESVTRADASPYPLPEDGWRNVYAA